MNSEPLSKSKLVTKYGTDSTIWVHAFLMCTAALLRIATVYTHPIRISAGVHTAGELALHRRPAVSNGIDF